MEWQKYGAALVGARRADGRPRFKTVILSVPRQQGKTILSRATVSARAQQAPDLQLYGTAQSRQYAAKHVVALGKELGDEVKLLRGVGAESVEWPNGSIYRPLSPTEGGGHGDSIDFMLVDEGWTLESAVMGGVRPAMIARPQSQLLIISTMGTLESHLWNNLVAEGRESVEDPEATTAYLEFSAPTDEAVFEDTCTEEGQPDCVWGEWMPALGITVMHEDIRAAIKDMLADPAQGRSEVIRAFGNRTTTSLVTLFPDEWVAKAWRVIEPPTRFVLALDVNESPAGASLATGHLTDEGAAVRPIAYQPGTPTWVPGKVREILRQRDVEAVVADFGGPARVLKAEIQAVCEEEGVALVDRLPRDLGADTGSFYDAIREGRIAIEKTEPFADAIAGAQRKDLGDLWLVSRSKMVVDASPLISGILAYGLAVELSVKPVVWYVLT